MKQWWTQLQEKEQRLVVVMLVMVTFFLFYHLVWSPINEGLTKEAKKLERNQELLAYVQQNAARYKSALKSGGNKAPSGSPLSIVNRVAKSYQININRVQPQGDDIQVWIEQVPFNQLLLWLDDLSQKQGLTIRAIDISEGDEKGLVKVRRLQLGKV